MRPRVKALVQDQGSGPKRRSVPCLYREPDPVVRAQAQCGLPEGEATLATARALYIGRLSPESVEAGLPFLREGSNGDYLSRSCHA